jgi:hypothetical protein
VITVPKLAGGGAEGGRRWWGGSGFHRRRWQHGVLLAGVSEGSEEAARKLLRVDVVLLVPLTGVKRLCIGGSTARPSGGGTLSSPAAGDDVWVREHKIGWAGEHQWVVAMLQQRWIGARRRCGRLTTVTRGYGGGPARGGARERKRSWKCSRVKARRDAWVAPGGARGPEEGVVTQEQELAAARESWRLGRRRRDVERAGAASASRGSGGAGTRAARGTV